MVARPLASRITESRSSAKGGRSEDIDWNSGRMTVTSPKTEHHEGKETRVVPIFPELAPVLAAAFEAAEEGAVYVIGGDVRAKALQPRGWRSCNLRTQFGRIIKRAGLKAWPRPFHNVRASRETELLREHPIHVVTAWLGNSPRIALKHYCMVTGHDFDRARGMAAAAVNTQSSLEVSAPEGRGTESGTVGAQNAAQRLHATAREDSHDPRANPSATATSAKSRGPLRNPAKPTSGEGGIRTRGPAFDRTRL